MFAQSVVLKDTVSYESFWHEVSLSEAGQGRGYKFMKKAVDQGCRAVKYGNGGPFVAVIVRDGAVLTTCHNLVRKDTDPSQVLWGQVVPICFTLIRQDQDAYITV